MYKVAIVLAFAAVASAGNVAISIPTSEAKLSKPSVDSEDSLPFPTKPRPSTLLTPPHLPTRPRLPTALTQLFTSKLMPNQLLLMPSQLSHMPKLPQLPLPMLQLVSQPEDFWESSTAQSPLESPPLASMDSVSTTDINFL
ncbi:hypothetical protein Ocin01_00074 [Orchesella cincta]|uniref:Uncharacterized protein n=1 Tax=Orchesella cincta TaxID=48709 RepID=A0A1D2NMX6_ORCCI|nr:hypothetical protein Ocin01_00074 [Orchesella cincta]